MPHFMKKKRSEQSKLFKRVSNNSDSDEEWTPYKESEKSKLIQQGLFVHACVLYFPSVYCC